MAPTMVRTTPRTSCGWRCLGILFLLWGGLESQIAAAEGPRSLCRNVDEKNSALLDSRLPKNFAEKVHTVASLVHKLQYEFDIPLSFIEHEAEEPIALDAAMGHTLEQALEVIVEQHQHYRCEALSGRLLLRTSDPLFDSTISGVDLMEEHRFPAMYAYINHLQAFDQRFKNWRDPLWAGSIYSPVFDGRVTLSPRAPLVLHLVELLGENPMIHFTVAAPSEYLPWRTISFGAARQPWERPPPRISPPFVGSKSNTKKEKPF